MQNLRQLIELFGAFLAAVLTFWLAPLDWAEPIFLVVLGISLAFGVLSNLGTKDPAETHHPATRVISFLFIGTDRPGAILRNGLLLRAFFVSTAFLVGHAASVFWMMYG